MKPVRISQINQNDKDFERKINKLLDFDAAFDRNLQNDVAQIISSVRELGDQALLEYTARFDDLHCKSVAELSLGADQLYKATQEISASQLEALKVAASRIDSYHLHQQQRSWQYEEADGSVLGQKVTPLDRVGLYVPGGKAVYPSSVLMNSIPAKIAGVEEIIMVVPAPGGIINPLILAAASVAKIDRVFTIGGAQAIAALAWGTQTLPRVDKIVGPGNCYVAEAKRQVFGRCGIDMIAGPSEVVILADNTVDPDWLAMDLFAQAEHDENAQSLLISDDPKVLEAVSLSIERLLPGEPRKDIIAKALERRGALILMQDMGQGLELINTIAPEHLQLALENPEKWLPEVRHAGAIFVGKYNAESLGDYCAGPNHVLPTAASARFSSPLGVYDFQKRSSIINLSKQGASKLAKTAAILAEGESLFAHGQSAKFRL